MEAKINEYERFLTDGDLRRAMEEQKKMVQAECLQEMKRFNNNSQKIIPVPQPQDKRLLLLEV